jgi:hypothetical protein
MYYIFMISKRKNIISLVVPFKIKETMESFRLFFVAVSNIG